MFPFNLCLIVDTMISFYVLAIYNFDQTGPYRLPLVLGEIVKIVEECAGRVSKFNEIWTQIVDCSLPRSSFLTRASQL